MYIKIYEIVHAHGYKFSTTSDIHFIYLIIFCLLFGAIFKIYDSNLDHSTSREVSTFIHTPLTKVLSLLRYNVKDYIVDTVINF